MEDGRWTVDGGRWRMGGGEERREKREERREGVLLGLGGMRGRSCSGYGRFDIEGLNQFFDTAIYIPD